MESDVWEDHRKEDGLNSPVGEFVNILADEAVFLEFSYGVDCQDFIEYRRHF